MVVLASCLLIAPTSLFADPPAAKTITLLFKSHEPDITDEKPMFYVTSSELPSTDGDWHPGMVDKSYKVGDMVGSFKIIKFIPLETKDSGDGWGTDKSMLILINDAKPPVKVSLLIGKEVTVTVK
jgi:hypothetical protein